MIRRICAWCPEPHDLESQPGDELEPDAISHGACALAVARLEGDNHGMPRAMRTVTVPVPVCERALLIGRAAGIRWDLALWHVAWPELQREPEEVSDELKGRLK